MTTLKETQAKIRSDPGHAMLFLMEFVDDFRREKTTSLTAEPFEFSGSRWDSLLASTAEALCLEMHLPVPEWLEKVPACKEPWFVSGLENLKAITLVESPLSFRIRKIFVLANFLNRV